MLEVTVVLFLSYIFNQKTTQFTILGDPTILLSVCTVNAKAQCRYL